MIELKKLNDMSIIDELSSDANIIINDKGEIKQSKLWVSGGEKLIILTSDYETYFSISDGENNYLSLKEELLNANNLIEKIKIFNNYNILWYNSETSSITDNTSINNIVFNEEEGYINIYLPTAPGYFVFDYTNDEFYFYTNVT